MLGEAARTHEDAERYAESYRSALARIAKEAKGGFRKSPGISVKLTALHPRYEWSHAEEAVAAKTLLSPGCSTRGKLMSNWPSPGEPSAHPYMSIG